MEIINHKLQGDNVSFKATTKTSGTFKDGDMDTIIIHYTASPSAKSAINALTNPNSPKASAHIVIDRDGSIVQLADFDTITWHAGRSQYKGRSLFNKYSIGIEVVNCGPISKKNGSYYNVYDQKMDDDDVMAGKHRNRPQVSKYWHKYPDAQVKAVEELCKTLMETYNIKHILGHEEISVGRKFDPGPAFPLDDMRDRLFEGKIDNTHVVFEEKDSAFVIASSLNIREAADGSAEKIANPLPNGTKVIVLEEKGNWVKVATKIRGWMTRAYIELDNTDEFYDGVVIASALNIREEADADSDKVAKALPRGTRIIILEQKNEWYKVLAPIVGYVSKKYLEKSDISA